MARPVKYTPEELEKKIDEYFQERLDKKKKINFCSIRDLCSYLEIDRQTFYNYKERPGYSAITKKAEDMILTAWEQQLFLPGRNTTGAIFYLKNFGGMADKVEHQVSGRIQHTHAARLDQVDQDTLQQLSAVVQALREGQEQKAIDVTPTDDD